MTRILLHDPSGEVDHACVVYAAINLANGHTYIGATEKGLKKRAARHLSNARRGQAGKFYCAVRKHGEASFKFVVLRQCSGFFDALDAEREYISWLRPEYNLTSGGGGVKGLKFSDSSKAKMSLAKKGKPGHPCPEWLKLKNAELRRTEPKRDMTPELRNKLLGNARKANEARRRPIRCLTDGRHFESVSAAKKVYGIYISHLLLTNTKSRSGLQFEYVKRPGQ